MDENVIQEFLEKLNSKRTTIKLLQILHFISKRQDLWNGPEINYIYATSKIAKLEAESNEFK